MKRCYYATFLTALAFLAATLGLPLWAASSSVLQVAVESACDPLLVAPAPLLRDAGYNNPVGRFERVALPSHLAAMQPAHEVYRVHLKPKAFRVPLPDGRVVRVDLPVQSLLVSVAAQRPNVVDPLDATHESGQSAVAIHRFLVDSALQELNARAAAIGANAATFVLDASLREKNGLGKIVSFVTARQTIAVNNPSFRTRGLSAVTLKRQYVFKTLDASGFYRTTALNAVERAVLTFMRETIKFRLLQVWTEFWRDTYGAANPSRAFSIDLLDPTLDDSMIREATAASAKGPVTAAELFENFGVLVAPLASVTRSQTDPTLTQLTQRQASLPKIPMPPMSASAAEWDQYFRFSLEQQSMPPALLELNNYLVGFSHWFVNQVPEKELQYWMSRITFHKTVSDALAAFLLRLELAAIQHPAVQKAPCNQGFRPGFVEFDADGYEAKQYRFFLIDFGSCFQNFGLQLLPDGSVRVVILDL